jgi:hypothetical protein
LRKSNIEGEPDNFLKVRVTTAKAPGEYSPLGAFGSQRSFAIWLQNQVGRFCGTAPFD